MNNVIRPLPDRRRECPFERTPSWRLILFAIASLWFVFFLSRIVLTVSPLVARGMMSSEPIGQAGLFVIGIMTVAAVYLWLFGAVLRRSMNQLDRRLFQ